MANDIKSKIILDGEKQYSAALKDANRNLKTLRSELKAETAELGKNATAQQKAEVKTKSLQKQIKEQETVVKTLTDALDEVKEKYGDNADEVAKWETKLNNARTTLANMKNDLDGVGDGLAGIGRSSETAVIATKSVADSLGKIAGMGGMIADGIGAGFTAMVSTAKEAISALWDSITDIAARSNNKVDLAGYWGTSVETIEKYEGAVAAASGSLEDLNAIVTKINAADGKKITELVGVSGENYEDQWQYAMAVMDALSKMETRARNAAGFEIFGKGATKMFDLANDWATVQRELDTFDPSKGGYGLTGEQLQSMSDLYDQVNKLEMSWSRLKDMATVQLFGQLSLDLTGNAQAILDSFLAYFNADSDAEREAALATIGENITQAFERVKAAIEHGIELLDKLAEDLKKSDNPTAQALGNILSGLVEALQWLTEDNMANVVKALEVLAGFWIAGKGAQMGLKIASIVKDIAVIKGFSGGGAVVGAGAGAAGGAAGGGSVLGTIGSAALGLGAAYGVHEALKTLKADTITDIFTGSDEQTRALLKAANQARGINTVGDMEASLLNDPEHTKKAFGLLLGGLGDTGGRSIVDDIVDTWHQIFGGGKAEEPQADRTLTEDQKMAAEAYWDALRDWSENRDLDAMGLAQEEFWDAFQGQEDLANSIDDLIRQLQNDNPEWQGMENLPTSWWQQNGNSDQITGSDLANFRGLPAQLAAAAQAGTANGVSGIKVTLDGYTVGRLVAPYVSQTIAMNTR